MWIRGKDTLVPARSGEPIATLALDVQARQLQAKGAQVLCVNQACIAGVSEGTVTFEAIFRVLQQHHVSNVSVGDETQVLEALCRRAPAPSHTQRM